MNTIAATGNISVTSKKVGNNINNTSVSELNMIGDFNKNRLSVTNKGKIGEIDISTRVEFSIANIKEHKNASVEAFANAENNADSGGNKIY